MNLKNIWPTWLNRNVLGFSLASTFSDTNHEIVPLVLPLLISQLVGKGSAPEYVALISGLSTSLASISSLISGTLSDQLDYRKPLIVIGYFFTGSLVGLLAFAQNWVSVMLLMGGAWIGRGLVSAPRSAIIADSTDKRYYGHAFGFRQALDTLGSVMGPLIVYFCAQWPINQIFLVALVPGLLAFLVVYFFIEDVPHLSKKSALNPLKKPFPRSFYSLLGVFFIFGIANFNKTLIVLRMQDVLSPEIGSSQVLATITLFYLFRNCVQTVASYVMGAISDTIGRALPLAVFGFGFFGIMALFLAWPTNSIYLAALIFFLSGVSAGTYMSLQKSYTADLVPEHLRGSGYGILETVNSFGSLTSSIVLGLLWSHNGPEVAFIFAALISFMSIAVLINMQHPNPK